MLKRLRLWWWYRKLLNAIILLEEEGFLSDVDAVMYIKELFRIREERKDEE